MAAFSSIRSPWRRSRTPSAGVPSVAAAFCILSTLGCEAQPPGVNEVALLQQLIVSPDNIDFGELKLNEVVSRVVEIRNNSSRTLHLLEPGRSCGCTCPKLAATCLAPGQCTTMEIELQPPPRPGPVSQSVWLVCREFPGAEWPVRIAARVVARIWAEPSEVDVEIPRGGAGAASVVLRHVPSVRIAGVNSDAPELSIGEQRETGVEARKVSLMIDGTALRKNQIIEGHLEVVLDSETTLTLRVPVRWRARSKIRFVPGYLIVTQHERGLQRRVNVLLDADIQPDAVDIAPLLPGIAVSSRKTQGRRVVLSLAVDAERVAPGRHSTALRARTRDSDEEDHLNVVCVPEG